SRSLVGETRFARAASWVEVRRSLWLSYSPRWSGPPAMLRAPSVCRTDALLNELGPEMVRETRFARAASWMGPRRSWLTELLPVAARRMARLVTRGVFVVGKRYQEHRPPRPRSGFPATSASHGPPYGASIRDTREPGILVRQVGIAPTSRAWQ